MDLRTQLFGPDRRNFSEFFVFLSSIPSTEQKYEAFFILKHSAFWKEKTENVDLRISIKRVSIYTLSCKIPESDVWVELFKGDSKENLLEKILRDGLGKISDIFKKYCILNRIQQNEKISINEFEINGNITLFRYEPRSFGFGTPFSIWKYEKSSIEIISRIGKDNRIESESLIKYFIVIGRCVVKDDYLESLLPKEYEISETEYGYVSSQPKSISEKVLNDSKETAMFLEKYNAISHYQYLKEKGRKIKYEDQDLYKKNVN